MPVHRLAQGVPGGAAALAAWSLAHGFAMLWASGSMARMAGDGTDPMALFGTVARLAFSGDLGGTTSRYCT